MKTPQQVADIARTLAVEIEKGELNPGQGSILDDAGRPHCSIGHLMARSGGNPLGGVLRLFRAVGLYNTPRLTNAVTWVVDANDTVSYRHRLPSMLRQLAYAIDTSRTRKEYNAAVVVRNYEEINAYGED